MKNKEKITKLVSILNIPLEESWPEIKEDYTIFHYFQNLGLIDSDTRNLILSQQMDFESNRTFDLFLENIDYYFRPVIYRNGTVADVGSGFGYLSCWFLLSGANRVLSIGDPDRIKFVEKLYNAAVNRDLLRPDQMVFKGSFVSKQDTSLSPVLGDGEVDLVFLHDTLEHITQKRLPALAVSSYNSLRSGGCFIAKQQNTDSKRMMSYLISFWDEAERTRFEPQRKEVIKERLGNLRKMDLERLVKATRGLDREDFLEAIAKFGTNGVMPTPPDTPIPPIDIIHDVPEEGDTSIDKITSILQNAGFSSVHVYPAMRSLRIGRAIQPIAKMVPSVFFKADFFSGVSVFVAKK